MTEKDEHFIRLEKLYQEAPISKQENPPSMEVYDGWTRVRMRSGPSEHHGGGAIHGSILFRLLDDAAFFAVNSKVRDAMVLTVQFDIQFARPVREGELTAIGELRTPGRELFRASASVYDEKGKESAYGTGSFMKSKLPVE
jgi:uncharacterized protein (TIGR00369 family)